MPLHASVAKVGLAPVSAPVHAIGTFLVVGYASRTITPARHLMIAMDSRFHRRGNGSLGLGHHHVMRRKRYAVRTLHTPPGCSLVPKLRLGNPMREAPASRGWVVSGSWSFEGRIPKLELGNERHIIARPVPPSILHCEAALKRPSFSAEAGFPPTFNHGTSNGPEYHLAELHRRRSE